MTTTEPAEPATPRLSTVETPSGLPVVMPAVLGWANPDTGPESLRLYALDEGTSPRWQRPVARVVEQALRERVTPYPSGIGEGDRYLVVRVGDRFTDDEAVNLFADLITRLVAEASREDGAIVTDRTTGAEIRLTRRG